MKSNAKKKIDSCQRTTPYGRAAMAKPIESVKPDAVDEDDDVICIPAPPPPLVCIESTDNETDDEESIAPEQIAKNVIANDNTKEDLKPIFAIKTDDLIDIPHTAVSSTANPTKPTYMYESECSDAMSTSESECSSTQINTKKRVKLISKHTSSSSSNGSDTSDSSDTDDNGMLFLDIQKGTSTPYLQRGEAIKNVTNVAKKQVEAGLHDISTSSHHTEGELLPMLSCVVHEEAVALHVTTDHSTINETNEDSTSIDAEHVMLSNIEENPAERRKIDDIGLNSDHLAEDSKTTNEMQPSPLADTDSVLPKISDVATEPNRTDKTNNGSVAYWDPEIGWNDEMKRFYHNSWSGENFNVTVSQRPMTSK